MFNNGKILTFSDPDSLNTIEPLVLEAFCDFHFNTAYTCKHKCIGGLYYTLASPLPFQCRSSQVMKEF